MKIMPVIIALIMTCAGHAAAATSIVTYSEFGSNCTLTQASNGLVSYSRPVCHTQPLLYLADAAGGTPGGVITAEPGYTFDVLDMDLIWSFPEILSVSVLDVPDGIDPLTPQGYDQVWQQNLWRATVGYPPNLRITGYKDGAVVAETFAYVEDSSAFDPKGIDDPRSFSDLGISLDLFAGLDRLEIANMTRFEDAVDLGVILSDERFWTCLDSCGFLVFDDIVLDVNANAVSPAPVPLPAGFALLLSGLGVLAAWGRRRAI